MFKIFLLIAAFSQSLWATNGVPSSKTVCIENRFGKTLATLKVDRSSVELISSDGPCDAKYFCYFFKARTDIKVSGYDVPSNSTVEYCDGAGLKEVNVSPEKTMSNGTITCKGNVYFAGTPSEICSCRSAKVASVETKSDRQPVISIPFESLLYFKNQKIVAFTPSQNAKVPYLDNLSAGSTYLISSKALEKVSRDDSRVPKCELPKAPDEGKVEKINIAYNLQKGDLVDISYTNTCETYLIEKEIEGVFGFFSKDKETDLFTVPKGTSVEFCGDQIGVLNTQGTGDIKFMDRPCKGYVTSIWRKNIFSKENQAFTCTLATSISEDGIEIPAGVKVVFRRNKLMCLRRDEENTDELIVGGMKLEFSDYIISKGKISKANSCWE